MVNAAFHTEIHNYAAADGTQHYAPAIALQIPKALGPAIHRVAGLQNFTTEERQSFNGPVVDFAGATREGRGASFRQESHADTGGRGAA